MTTLGFFYQSELFQDLPPPDYGYSRHLVSEYAAYDAASTARVRTATGDNSISHYTYTLPDANPLYIWAREEPAFTSLMTAGEKASVLSLEAAVAAGMLLPTAAT